MGSIKINGSTYNLQTPKIMGIVNVTPDSFYAQSRTQTEEAILNQCSTMQIAGVDIIDIGAYSSRPGAQHIDKQQEMIRLERALTCIRKEYPNVILSIDTFRAEVAAMAVNHFDANIINDISAGEMDRDMFKTIQSLNIPYIMMHMQGTPATMQIAPMYTDVATEVMLFFAKKKRELNAIGVHDIIIDPGFGFGKTTEQNYELLNKLDLLTILQCPVLVGISRKSMIYKTLQQSADTALNGTTALHAIALQRGADILRVHDVKQAKEVVALNKMLNTEAH